MCRATQHRYAAQCPVAESTERIWVAINKRRRATLVGAKQFIVLIQHCKSRYGRWHSVETPIESFQKASVRYSNEILLLRSEVGGKLCDGQQIAIEFEAVRKPVLVQLHKDFQKVPARVAVPDPDLLLAFKCCVDESPFGDEWNVDQREPIDRSVAGNQVAVERFTHSLWTSGRD